MTILSRRTLAALLATGLSTACNDPIRTVADENTPTLVDEVDSFRYQAFRLDNVHDTLRWTWTNNGIEAVVTHNNFIPHGDTRLTVRDPDGEVIYQAPLQTPEGQSLSKVTGLGRPGVWTIQLDLYGVDGGRIDFSVVRMKDAIPTPTAQDPDHS